MFTLSMIQILDQEAPLLGATITVQNGEKEKMCRMATE